MAKQEKEVERWITVNGARVPVFKDGSVGGPPALRKKVESSLKKKSEKKDSFQRAADHEVSNSQNAKENVELLKKELKKHPDDAHTAEIKARLKKAQEHHEKLKKGDTSDSNFKTAKEWDERKDKKAAPKSKTPEFKSAEEAEKYYQEKFAGVSSTYANKMAAKLGIEGKGKEKREALAKAYTEKWKQSQSINKDLDLKDKQIARNAAQKESLNKSNWEVEKGRYGQATTTVGDTTYRISYNKQWGEFTLTERRKDGAGWITTGGDYKHPITLGYSKQEALTNAIEYLEDQKKRKK